MDWTYILNGMDYVLETLQSTTHAAVGCDRGACDAHTKRSRTMTVEELQRELDTRDDGILRHGSHEPGREFCALEFVSQVEGLPWTDSPSMVGMPDLRPLNDAHWSSNKARTEALL